jgi:capsule polysaccharide modification protein KpsS
LLDTDSYLVVKEHTNAIGDRSAEFYKKCQALPNVLIANATESAGEIIKKSKGVFTVSGTIALEAMLFEVPSFTLANAFFNGYGKCIRITQEDLKNKTFGDLVNQSNNNAKSIEDFKKMVQQYSYDGIIGDAIHTDGVMDPSNITNLTKAFLAII